MRNDNLVIFISRRGSPCGEGSQTLAEAEKLPNLERLTLACARPIPYKRNKYIIVLTVKDRASELIDRDIIKEAMNSLLDVVKELGLEEFSISREGIDNVPWLDIRSLIEDTLSETNIKITVCTNAITIPTPDKRDAIIRENHASTIGGHKGVSKTYHRMKERYYWPGMKTNVQAFVNKCRKCQLGYSCVERPNNL